jgi:hypothetical protein
MRWDVVSDFFQRPSPFKSCHKMSTLGECIHCRAHLPSAPQQSAKPKHLPHPPYAPRLTEHRAQSTEHRAQSTEHRINCGALFAKQVRSQTAVHTTVPTETGF